MTSTIVTLYYTDTDDCRNPKVELNNSYKGLASKVGVKEVFWQPHTNHHYFAGSVIPVLEEGIEKLYEEKVDSLHTPVSGLIAICEQLLGLCYENKSAHLVSRINKSKKV